MVSVPQSTKALEKAVRRRPPPVTFASSGQSVMKMLRMSGKTLLWFLKIMSEINYYFYSLAILSRNMLSVFSFSSDFQRQ